MSLEPLWRSPPSPLILGSAEIHVWRASLDLPSQRVDEMVQILSANERQRADIFHLERERQRFIVGRAVLRRILSFYLELDPDQVQFWYGPHGKPYLASRHGKLKPGFNLAHAGPLALFAFKNDQEIGIDVELVRPTPDMDLIASRFFSPSENKTYQALPEYRKEMGFYRSWVRKEAYLKALGEGFSQHMECVDVSLLSVEQVRQLNTAWDPDELDRWSLISFTPSLGFVAALAVPGHDDHAITFKYE